MAQMTQAEFITWLEQHGWIAVGTGPGVINARQRHSTRVHIYVLQEGAWRIVHHRGRRVSQVED